MTKSLGMEPSLSHSRLDDNPYVPHTEITSGTLRQKESQNCFELVYQLVYCCYIECLTCGPNATKWPHILFSDCNLYKDSCHVTGDDYMMKNC